MSDYPPPETNDGASDSTPATHDPSRKWKTWQLAAASVLALFIGIGMGGSGSETTDTAPAAAPEPAETVTVTETVTESAPEPPAEPDETEPTLEPTVDPTVGAAVFAQVFEDNRAGLADAIESDFGPVDVESVDQLSYDAEAQTIRLAVTSAYQGDDRLRDVAWSLTRLWVGLYGDDGLVGVSGITPAVEISVSGVRYVCPGEFMMRLVDRDATREDWNSACRA